MAFGKGDGRSLADADFDFALADAVFDRIVGQVLQQLADLGFVGGNLRNVVFKVNFDFYFAFGGFLRQGGGNIFGNFQNIDGFIGPLIMIKLNFGKGKQVFD